MMTAKNDKANFLIMHGLCPRTRKYASVFGGRQE